MSITCGMRSIHGSKKRTDFNCAWQSTNLPSIMPICAANLRSKYNGLLRSWFWITFFVEVILKSGWIGPNNLSPGGKYLGLRTGNYSQTGLGPSNSSSRLASRIYFYYVFFSCTFTLLFSVCIVFLFLLGHRCFLNYYYYHYHNHYHHYY